MQQFGQALEDIDRDIGNGFEAAGREIGRFFGGLFGHKHSSPPQPETFDYYSSASATSNTLGYSGGSGSSFGIQLPLINNFIEPSNQPLTDVEMAMNFLPMGTTGRVASVFKVGTIPGMNLHHLLARLGGRGTAYFARAGLNVNEPNVFEISGYSVTSADTWQRRWRSLEQCVA